mgnify:CR=1 FL=1
MLIIKDAMILIHLAKLSLLEISCDYFEEVMIPKLVSNEVLNGIKNKYPDAKIIEGLIEEKKIIVKEVKEKFLIKKANQFNIQKGEAEVVALYWQEEAKLIATDDDNVRKKKILLNLNLIGTPAIILLLYQNKKIDNLKLKQSLTELKKIGWFNNSIFDKITMEAQL